MGGGSPRGDGVRSRDGYEDWDGVVTVAVG